MLFFVFVKFTCIEVAMCDIVHDVETVFPPTASTLRKHAYAIYCDFSRLK